MAHFFGNAIKFIISFLVVVVIAAVYAIVNIDLNDYKTEVTEAVEQATGRQFHVEGDLSLAWSLFPKLQVEKATFSNATWGSQPIMLSLDKFEVNLAILPLLGRHIQVTKVALIGSNILIETDKEGMGNWEFPQTNEPEKPDSDEAVIESTIINELVIENTNIEYRDGVTGDVKQVSIEMLSLDVDDLEQPIELVFKALIDEMPVQLEGEFGGVTALVENNTSLVDLQIDVAGVELTLDGEVAIPHEAKGVSLNVDLQTDATALSALTGSELPPFGDLAIKGHIANEMATDILSLDLSAIAEGLTLSVKGQIEQPQEVNGLALNIDLQTDASSMAALSGEKLAPFGDISLLVDLSGGENTYEFNKLLLKAGKTDLAGDITVDLAESRPIITAQLSSNLIDVVELTGETVNQDTKQEPAEKNKDARLFSDDPLVLQSLKSVDANVTIKVQEISTSSINLKQTDLGVVLNNGHLEIKPLTSSMMGSRLKGMFELNAQTNVAELNTNVELTGFKLSKLPDLKDTLTGGNTDLFIKVKGKGSSVRELMAGLNGKVIAKMAESDIAGSALDIVSIDILSELISVLNPLAKESKGSHVVCSVVNFDIKNGIAVADRGIAVMTDKMNIIGSGQIDLKTEKIDIGITPQPREGLGVSLSQLAGLVSVGGTLASPEATVDKTAVLETGVSAGAAVATGGLSILVEGLLDRTIADSDPCKTALGLKEVERRVLPEVKPEIPSQEGDAQPNDSALPESTVESENTRQP